MVAKVMAQGHGCKVMVARSWLKVMAQGHGYKAMVAR